MSEQKPKRRPEFEVNMLVDGSLVLFNNKTSIACTLTPLAALVWEYCDGAHTFSDIVSELRRIDEITQREGMEEEVQRLLAQFASDDLVTVEQ
jgi:hypothetical protein